MTTSWVVDASVAAQWVLPGPDSDAAIRLRGSRLVAPAFLDIECAGLLWKAMRRGELSPAEALDCQATLGEAPVERLPDAALLPAAMSLATDSAQSVQDCLYVAAAVLTGFPLVTADRRLRSFPWREVARAADIQVLGLEALP